MKILADFRDKILYIQLLGEVDEHNAALIRKNADNLADAYAPRAEKVIFDLRQISFMDSTGIGFLIGRYKKFQRYGVPVYVTNPTLATDRILAMSGIYSLMQKI